jgi:hypothetical protein
MLLEGPLPIPCGSLAFILKLLIFKIIFLYQLQYQVFSLCQATDL